MILAHRRTSSSWLAVGAIPADDLENSPLWSRRDDQPLVVARLGDASVLYPAPTLGSATRRLIQAIRRRRPRGIVAVCDMQAIEAGLSPPASALAGALPDLPVAIILVDRRLGTMPAALGGAGASPELVTAWIEEALAAQTVAHIDEHGLAPDGDPAAIFRPGHAAEHRTSWLATIDNALAALPTGRFAGLHVVGQCDHPVSDTLPASLATLAAANPPPRRPPRPPAVAALCLLIPAGLAIGAWWSVGDIARTALRQKTVIAQAASADGISPLAMATLGDLVTGIRTGGGRKALVPSSWLNGLEKILAEQVRTAIGPTMLQPVRKHLDARYEELAASVAGLEGGSDTSPQTIVATAEDILQRVAAFDQQARRFQLLAEGNVHDQWQPLLAAASGAEAAPPVAWLADDAGAALFIRALTEFGWQPPKTEPLLHRVAAALGQASITDSWLSSRRDAIEKATALYADALGRLSSTRLSDEAALGAALADLIASLDQLAVAGQALAEGLAPLDTDATAALASVGREAWQQSIERLGANQAKAATEAMALKVPGLGPLFKIGRNGRPELAPAVRAAATTMRALAQANFHAVPASTMPELGSLARRNSSPDPQRIAGADERLAEYRTWLKSSSGTVPEAVLRPIVDVVAFQVALAVVMDVAAAYQADLPEDEGVLPADIVASVVSGLDSIDHGMGGDVAWLIGVRAYRRLEAIDTAYERANPFRLSGVVREWSGDRPILDVVGWKTADERRGRLSDGLRAIRDHRNELNDLLRILSLPLVAAELTDPRLVKKWRHLTLAANDPDGPGAAGYRTLRTLIVDRLAGFRAADCGHLDTLPRAPSRPGDPFAAELTDIVRTLSDRCAALRHPPQSGPRTPPPPVPGD